MTTEQDIRNLNFIVENSKKIKNGEKLSSVSDIENLEKSIENLNNHLIKYIRQNPKTEFIVVIPSYSIVQSAIFAQYRDINFKNLENSLKYLIQSSNELENLKIYGFFYMDFISNLNNYMDYGHHSAKINSKMLEWIRDDVGLLNEENFQKYWDNFSQKAKSYDLIELSKTIEKFLDENQ